MFSHSKILFLVPLLFVTSIPTYFLNFNFIIILVYLLFIHAKLSPTELYQCICIVLLRAYVIIMLVCRRLLATCLHGKAAV